MNSKCTLDAPILPNSAQPHSTPNAIVVQDPVAQHPLAGKRVAVVIFSTFPFDPRPRREAEALRDLGATVDFICLTHDKSEKREVANGINVRRIAIQHERGGKFNYVRQYTSFILVSGAMLTWRSLRRRYHLVHVHNMPDVLVAASFVPKLLGAKVVLDQHDPMPELMKTIFGMAEDSFYVRLIKRLEKWSFKRAHLVLTVNEACKRIFAARSCAPEKIGVVMNTPDGKIFPFRPAGSYEPKRKVGGPFVIMYHGSIVERNGLDLAVRALVRIRTTNPQVQLRIYGKSTAFLDKVMAEARELGVADLIAYNGPMLLEKLVHEIEKCDLGVIPNQNNPFTDINTPTRIFEYLALGKPVVAPRTLGIQDYFHSDSLFFFESGNGDNLAETIEYVAANPDKAASVAERGQAVYLAHSWERERSHLQELVGSLFQGAPLHE